MSAHCQDDSLIIWLSCVEQKPTQMDFQPVMTLARRNQTARYRNGSLNSPSNEKSIYAKQSSCHMERPVVPSLRESYSVPRATHYNITLVRLCDIPWLGSCEFNVSEWLLPQLEWPRRRNGHLKSGSGHAVTRWKTGLFLSFFPPTSMPIFLQTSERK